MLKRILASLALTSLLCALVLCVYWWRGRHGYVDTFTMGKGTATESLFTSERNPFTGQGEVVIEVTNNDPRNVVSTIKPYFYRDFMGYFLLVPGLWVAIKVRSMLPRPPGMRRGRNAE